jgi:hypothetical protein
VRWDNNGNEHWYGRFGIELEAAPKKPEYVSPTIVQKQIYICSTCGNNPCICYTKII